MKIRSMVGPGWRQTAVAILAGVAVLGNAIGSASATEVLAGVSGKKLLLFSSDEPDDVVPVQLSGLQPGEDIIALDVRPATGELYALGSSIRLYTVDPLTGVATIIGSGPFTNALSGTRFGFDFNPTVDRIRLVSDTGLNLRLNPTNGLIAAFDGNLAYATNDSGFGLKPKVVGSAYINNDTDPATATVLYDIDAKRDVLVIQNPPNNGTLITVGALGVNASKVVGFDVAGSDGTAYASIVPVTKHGKDDETRLYTINLMTGAATCIGKIGGNKPVRGLTALGQWDDFGDCNQNGQHRGGHGRDSGHGPGRGPGRR